MNMREKVLASATVWFIFILGETLLSLQIPFHVINQNGLSFGYKILLLGANYFLLAICILFVTVLLSSLSQKWLTGWVGSAVKFFLFLFVSALVFFLALDWVLFYDYRAFINLNILKLIAYDPHQMFLHAWSIDPRKTVIGFVLPPVFVFLLCGFIKNTVLRMQRNIQDRLIKFISLFLVLCFLIFNFALILYFNPKNGFLNKFRVYFKTRTAPEASLFSELLLDPFLGYSDRFSDKAENFKMISYLGGIIDQKSAAFDSWRIPVVEKPIISMQDYLRTFNTSAIRRYNVILILVESLRPDQLMAFGGLRQVMPFLDSLASSACIFTNTFNQASNSSYADLCVLSSHYPLRSRSYYLYPKHIPYPRVLIYDVLKALGYKTAIISSQNERWGAMSNYLETGSLDKFLHAGNYSGDIYAANEHASLNLQGKIDDYYTVQEAISWIDKISPQENFFLYMNLQNSHVPYRIPAGFPRKFSLEKPDFVIGFNNYPHDKSWLVKDVYADSLRYVDTQIERLFSYLQERKLLDKTVFIVTGDTGQAFYEHGFAGHSNKLYNEVIKVPLIIKAPGVPQGIKDDRLAQHIDILPSVFSLLHIGAHPSFQGASLFDPPQGGAEPAAYSIVQSYALQYAIIKGDWKLIFDAGEWEYFLYNLRKDPGELFNMKDKYPEIVKDLSGQLTFWRLKQLEYYADPDKYLKYYPPFFKNRK
jgi:arylsulfatase A-like enzyme